MKTSKIAMGVGALALTALAAFTGKANFRAGTYWYHPVSAPTTCISTTVNFNCSTGGSSCIITAGANTGQQLFNSNACQVPLQRQ